MPEPSYVHATVYSNFMLVGETWYCTIECARCGRIDEAVSWEQAKTPRHAALIAEERHAPCREELDTAIMREAGLQEIRAAEYLLECQHFNRDRAAQVVADAEGLPEDAKMRDIIIADARAELARHERGLVQAERRVQDVRRDNTPNTG